MQRDRAGEFRARRMLVEGDVFAGAEFFQARGRQGFTGVFDLEDGARLDALFRRPAAFQLGHRHVRVIAICPSYIATGMFDGAKPAAGTWMLDADAVAARVVRAMEKYHRVVLLPWTVRFVVLMRGLLPRRVYYWFLRRIGVNTSMRDWRGRG